MKTSDTSSYVTGDDDDDFIDENGFFSAEILQQARTAGVTMWKARSKQADKTRRITTVLKRELSKKTMVEKSISNSDRNSIEEEARTINDSID